MLLRFILLIPLTLQTIKCNEKIIPVLMIDYSGLYGGAPGDQVISNPFRKISTAQFADIVQVAIKKAAVVIIFIEEQFCVEDISTKDAFGTPYQHLHKALTEGKVKYFPKVIEPYKLLNQVFKPLQFNVFHLGSGVNLKMFEEKNNYLYVYFRDDGKNEPRVKKLRRHDAIMTEVYTTMMKLAEGPVLAFYTGKRNPVNVDKVDFLPILPSPGDSFPGVTVITDGGLFWFFGVYAATPTRRALFDQMPILAEETWTDHALSTRMAYSDFDLKFDFKFSETGWVLETVMLFEGGEEVGRTEMAVRAPWHHAYYCAEPMELINKRDGSSVIITEYKIQAARHRRRRRCGVGRQRPNIGSLRREGRDAGFKKQTKTRPNNVTMIPPPVDGTLIMGRELHRRRRQEDPPEEPTEPQDTTTSIPTTPNDTSVEGGSSDCGFGPTVSCGPYFSVGILSALFVVGICLVFLGFSLIAINDCNTNDRYDDPRGRLPVLGVER